MFEVTVVQETMLTAKDVLEVMMIRFDEVSRKTDAMFETSLPYSQDDLRQAMGTT